VTATEQEAAVLPPVVCVTGTDTEVGKTIVTAVLAVSLTALGRSVAAYKPTQAGTEDGEGDIDVVRRLAALDDVAEGIRLAHAMAPAAAAERAGVRLPALEHQLAAIAGLAAAHDHTLVEGAGGLLVALDHSGHTLADIAAAPALRAAAVVVCRSGLGTLNHTELTLEALDRRGIDVAGLVIGSWPAQPTDIEISNREYLTRHPVPLIGAIPQGAGRLAPAQFRRQAPGWLTLAQAPQQHADVASGAGESPNRVARE
jgi:dethiobiotin synthase